MGFLFRLYLPAPIFSRSAISSHVYQILTLGCYTDRMFKDFDDWNKQKKLLDRRTDEFFFHEGEVWWCSVGLNIATEVCGKYPLYRRPVLVFKKLSKTSFIGIPITTKKKDGSWFAGITICRAQQFALLHQVRMFSVHRLQRRLTVLAREDFAAVAEKLKQLLELSDNHRR